LLVTAAGIAACSNNPSAPADAFVNAAVGGGSQCSAYPSLKEFVEIGTATSGHPNTVQDGGQDRNGNVSVTCKVTPNGNGFDIQLTAVEAGVQGGSLTINSPGQGTVTANTSTGVSASFAQSAGGTSGIVFRESASGGDPGCTITYLYDPGGSVGGVGGDKKVPVNPPIAAGRIWGHIKCPNAASQSQPGTYCVAEADFIFEQCDQ
jgi:hypothetical protein